MQFLRSLWVVKRQIMLCGSTIAAIATLQFSSLPNTAKPLKPELRGVWLTNIDTRSSSFLQFVVKSFRGIRSRE
jgi:uncharacterized lipoprotein YddW (UPF0748 family)